MSNLKEDTPMTPDMPCGHLKKYLRPCGAHFRLFLKWAQKICTKLYKTVPNLLILSPKTLISERKAVGNVKDRIRRGQIPNIS